METQTISFWSTEDFDVFTIEGLENRMKALQTRIQPKFQQLGDEFSAKLSAHGKGEFFTHVARHARRTVNPPSDSWVAMAPSKRGYKALPHFQIGLWKTHLFVIIAVIYENPDKKGIAERLEKEMATLLALPEDFIVSGDHMKAEASLLHEIGEEGLLQLLDRLQSVKKAEFLIGRHLSKAAASEMTAEALIDFVDTTIDELLPIYDIIVHQ